MSIALTINGAIYTYPEEGDSDWGADATAWAQAVTNSLLPQTGGSFFLTGELSFGSSAGIKTLYVKTNTANPASTGMLRLANTDKVTWRNAGNSGNLSLGVDTGNILEFNGVDLVDASTPQSLSNKNLTSSQLTSPTVSYPGHAHSLIWVQQTTGIVGGFTPLSANAVITTDASGIPTMTPYLSVVDGGTNNPILDVAANRVMYGDGAKVTSTAAPSITNQVLQFNGTIPAFGNVLDVDVYKSATAPSSPTQGDLWYDTANLAMKAYSGTSWESTGTINEINDLSDVVISTPITNEVLKWNGTNWVNGPDASAGSPLWGTIAGTLSNQTDLQTALNAKQALDADLTAIAALTGTSGNLRKIGANAWDLDTTTYSPSTHNHNGIYEAANGNIQLHIASTSNPHSVTKDQVGLGNANNTSDLNKPISTATQTALDNKSNITHSHTLDNLSDVVAISPTNGQILRYNSVGGIWENATQTVNWGSIGGTLSTQSDLQLALTGKQNFDADLTAISGLTGTTGFLKKNGANNWELDNSTYSISSHTHTGVYEAANANIQTHITATNNPHSVTKAQVGLGNVPNVKMNLAATTDPTVSDDTGDGYSIGSKWVNITSQQEYTCTNTTTGAAVWKSITGSSETNRIAGVNTQTNNYTLVLSDENKLIKVNSSVYKEVTVPPNSSVAFAIGSVVHVMQYGVGLTGVVAGAGVTIRTSEALITRKQYSLATLIKIDTDEWVLAGYMEAV